jgi:hypothetical protein
VSEYRYCDFKAIDHALTKTEIAALRAISARAVISHLSGPLCDVKVMAINAA